MQNEQDRRRAAEIWGVPVEKIDPRPSHTALSMFRALERGDIRFLWIQATDPMVSLPNLGRYRQAAAKDDRFIVVSEAYPTPTTDMADVVLPAAMWIEREGVFANVGAARAALRADGRATGGRDQRRLADDRGGAPARLLHSVSLDERATTWSRSGRSTAASTRIRRPRCHPSPSSARSPA